jgi:phenylalanyl-tRNA synthetase alpha chain
VADIQNSLDIPEMIASGDQEISRLETPVEVDAFIAKYMSKQGLLRQALRSLGQMPATERAKTASLLNTHKDAWQTLLQSKQDALAQHALAKQLLAEKIDVTLPASGQDQGSLHPITWVNRRMLGILKRFGFDVMDGPEIEDDFHNFTALNIPEDHPARAMHDTFYLRSPGKLLRTHTSNVQIRTMGKFKPPLRIVSAGRVFRVDSLDMTHTPMFHQLEGLLVSEDATFVEMKVLLESLMAEFFGKKMKLRFRPSYFPFTEPSAEVDIQDANGKWMEVLGCGMVHPNVLTQVGIDPQRYRGYAFGFGIDRFAMLWYGVEDIRTFFNNDLAFLAQFQDES